VVVKGSQKGGTNIITKVGIAWRKPPERPNFGTLKSPQWITQKIYDNLPLLWRPVHGSPKSVQLDCLERLSYFSKLSQSTTQMNQFSSFPFTSSPAK
jgi:hypothetical protein